MATEEMVMHDSNTTVVLSMLPPYDGKSVLELGAGIGSFTEELAKKAAQLLVLDFFGNGISKDENINGHHKDVKVVQADVTSDLSISPNSIDLIFSNLLLMHLSDKEAASMVQRMLEWLKPAGYILFIESCFTASMDRKPGFYMKVFKECHMQDESGNSYELSLVGGKCIGAYSKSKICWLWQKIESKSDKGFQEFLDSKQYKYTVILRYERIFGSGFVSTGGIDTTKEFLPKLELKPGQKVLDVGCGIGGGNFYMADAYGVEVVGIDLSINMISLALERAVGLELPVEFEVADCTKKIYPDHTFDVIYSRDTILHIQMLRDAGFDEVIAEDRTDQFILVLQKELDSTEKDKDRFISDFSKKDYDDIVNGWKAKLVRSTSGEQRWGLFIAKKH